MQRVDFLKQSASGILMAATGNFSPESVKPKNVIRVAHLTDIHLKKGIVPETGMAKALHSAQSLKPEVHFIMNTGDSIMDALEATEEKTQQQWNLFNSILNKENSLPIFHAIGNHDIWGWFLKGNKPVADPRYGKGWVVQNLQLSNRYYQFKKGKWNFIVLDSAQLNPAGGYIALIDTEQLAWLESTLKNIPAKEHVCIVSHIPILSICSGLFFGKPKDNGDHVLQRNLMHSDFFKLKAIFNQYPNIKACISGHIHLQDEVEYLGIKYYCNGAVSGNWWGGSYQEFAPAYALMEFFEDGSTKRTIVNYDPKR